MPRHLPVDLQTNLNAIAELLSKLETAVHDAADRYTMDPVTKLSRGQLLSRQEYFALRASFGLVFYQGVDITRMRSEVFTPYIESVTHIALGLSKTDDYELFKMFWVEAKGYVNVARRLEPRFVGGFGTAPEGIALIELRPEQRAFFQSQLTDIYRRFGG
jgi:hypothetical protein